MTDVHAPAVTSKTKSIYSPKLNVPFENVSVNHSFSKIMMDAKRDWNKYVGRNEMSRTIPRVYVTANWSKNRVDAESEARKYCRELVNAGYLPLCPVLAFSGIISEKDPDGEKKRREMSEDLLKRARFLVVCGEELNDDVKEDISIAKRSKVIPTTLAGILNCM